ncbi:MAG: hypothetical protein AAF716_23000 [Cyanobacteria bacterium P01_D01_bin.1]
MKNTTYGDGMFEAGYMSVCEKIVGESFFLATLYHEWFIIEPNPIFASQSKA